MENAALQIGEVAARAGVTIDTIRYYERRRLLARAGRTMGGFRLFAPETIERIRFIKQAQEIGLSLAEIKELLTASGGAEECRRMSELLRGKLSELDGRINVMREFRQTLVRHLAACEHELEEHGMTAECPVVIEITHHKSARNSIDAKKRKR